jgi:hypothetical protein
MNIIVCVVCQKEGMSGDCHSAGWRLAPNRIGGYTCSVVCDDKVVAYDKALKEKNKQGKKK